MHSPRAIILADGKGTRWNWPTPKHLTVINGEVILHRTVRQLSAHGIEDIWITSHDTRYTTPGSTRYEPPDNLYQIDRFYACRELWLGRATIFLHGDVYFSDAAIDTILNTETVDYRYFQRTHASKITGKPWKEGFAMTVVDTNLLVRACSHLREIAIQTGRTHGEYHQLQGYLEGHGAGQYFEEQLGPHGIEIDDETEDFDQPSDVSRWMANVQEWRSQNQYPCASP